MEGLLSEPFDTKVQIVENGVKYIVDVEEGQKTGFSLTRSIIDCPFIKFVREWMCWTALPHTGSFALNAGIAGQKAYWGLMQASLRWIRQRRNAKLNGLQEVVKFQCEDVFALLPRLEAEGRKFRCNHS